MVQLIDFFQIAIVRLYRMLDQAEISLIITFIISDMYVYKNGYWSEIQKTQSGTVQKVPNMFKMLVSATINFSTNMLIQWQ